MRFYIKPNQTPPSEVAFWLHVDVGAADEETGEEGMAHFIEHMAFNGTKFSGESQLVYCRGINVEGLSLRRG